MKNSGILSSRAFKYGAIYGFWLLLGFFFILQAFIYSSNNQAPFNWYNNLTYRLPVYILFALFTPLFIQLARKYAITRITLIRNISIHLALSLLIGFIHKFLSIYITFMIRSLDGQLNDSVAGSLMTAKYAILGGTIDSVLMYWIVIICIMGWDYYNKYRRNELFTLQLESKLALAELDSLKMQLHPHFLFNTLHSISTLMHRDVKTADRMLNRLSDLLRNSFESAGKHKVALNEELEFLNKYLEIQSIRFEDRLKVSMDIDDNVLDVQVPNLLLQPLVENAIKYAVEPSEEAHEITISARQDNAMLVIVISDTGPGLDEDFKQGIGIANTKERLRQLYGGNHLFEMTNKESGGLEIKVALPAGEDD